MDSAYTATLKFKLGPQDSDEDSTHKTTYLDATMANNRR